MSEFNGNYRNVYYQAGKEPVFCYRSGLSVYEETFKDGTLMSSGWNSAGYPLNVLSECNTRLNNSHFAEPQAFCLDIDGEYCDRSFEFIGFTCSEEDSEHTHSVITLHDSLKDITVKVHTLLDGTPVLSRWLEIINCGSDERAVSTLAVMSGGMEDMNARNLSFNRQHDEYYTLGYMDSASWGTEGDFSWHKLNPDETSISGRFQRDRYRHPMFMLRNNVLGTIFICQLAYSGGYKFSFDYNAHDEQADTHLAFKASIDALRPLCLLRSGETLMTPAVHIGIIAGGHDEAVNAMHEHIRRSVFTLAEADGSACLIGSGMGPEHDMLTGTTKQFIDQMAKAGAEVFIIDAGWYCPPGSVDQWWNKAGDWKYDTERYPNGIDEMREYAHSKGMKFGLWMESERMGPASEIRKEHPEWITCRTNRVQSNGFIDLTNPEAFKWVEEQAAHVISDYKLDLFRIDYNIGSDEYFYISNSGSRRECMSLRHIQAFYRLYNNLKRRFPNVIFENCAGGGGRTDIGQTANFNHTWVSDCQKAPRSVLITNGMTMALPPERVDRLVAGMGCHAFGSLDLHMRNAMFGHISLNVFGPKTAEMNPQIFEFICHSTDIYKNFIRPFLPKCRIYHHTPDTKEIKKNGFTVIEEVSEDSAKGIIGVFSMPDFPSDEITIYPRGLDISLNYTVTFDNKRSSVRLSGYELVNNGIRVRIPSSLSSELILFEAEK